MAKTGRNFNDRVKAADVRNKLLDEVLLVLADDPVTKEWSDLKKQLLLKMSSNLLPRLNEHTGEDGKELKIQITGESAARFNVTS